MYPIISALPLVDRNVGTNQETVDFDIKHLAKQVRNCFISGNFQISDTFLSTKDVRCILSLSDFNTNGIDQLVNPENKQNVPLATDFLQTLTDALGKEMLSSPSFRVASISEELKMLFPILTGILSLYAIVEGFVEEQLKGVSCLTYVICFAQTV